MPTECLCNYCRKLIKSPDNVESLTCAKCGREYMLDQVKNKITEEVEPKWVCVKRATRIRPGNSAVFTPAGLREWSKPQQLAYCDVRKATDWKVVSDLSGMYGRGVVAIESQQLARAWEATRQILVKKMHIRARDPKMFWRTDVEKAA